MIEQGAVWLPSWMRQMESAVDAFGRHEERLRALSLRPSEYVRRQVRVTPYPTEDVGWIIRESGPRGVHVLLGLPSRRGRPPADRALRVVPGRRFGRDPAASTATTSSTLMGTAATALARGPLIGELRPRDRAPRREPAQSKVAVDGGPRPSHRRRGVGGRSRLGARRRELVKVHTERDFAGALDFVNRVGEIAELANHHPDIEIKWNTVTLRLSTHSAGGSRHADLELAKRIDALPAALG